MNKLFQIIQFFGSWISSVVMRIFLNLEWFFFGTTLSSSSFLLSWYWMASKSPPWGWPWGTLPCRSWQPPCASVRKTWRPNPWRISLAFWMLLKYRFISSQPLASPRCWDTDGEDHWQQWVQVTIATIEQIQIVHLKNPIFEMNKSKLFILKILIFEMNKSKLSNSTNPIFEM